MLRNQLPRDKNTVAWILLISAVAVHVIDEALTGFLPFYNQLVLDLRGALGFFPMPTFSFGVWLGGLVFAIVVGFALIPLVRRGGRLMRVLTLILGVVMILNAGAHIVGSIYMERIVPGFWSSAFLLMSASLVVIRGLDRAGWKRADFQNHSQGSPH